MYCVVREYKMKNAGDIERVVDKVRSGFLPIVTKEPGYVAYSVALSERRDLTTVGFFLDKGAADDSTRRAADWVRENLADAVEGPPKVTAGEVRIQEVRSSDAGFGALRRLTLQPGKLSDALDLVQAKLIPLLTGVSGFLRFAFVEAGPDQAVTLSAWRDRASAQEATRRATEFMQANAGEIVAGPPEMIDGEIKLHDVNEAALAQSS